MPRKCKDFLYLHRAGVTALTPESEYERSVRAVEELQATNGQRSLVTLAVWRGHHNQKQELETRPM